MEPRFRIFGIPVQVSLLFFLVLLFLRPDRKSDDQIFLTMAWLSAAFVGVLMHELGHALVARAFGQQPAIALHAMGGVTVWRPRQPLSAGPRFLISAAGPAVGLVVGSITWLVARQAGLWGTGSRADAVLRDIIWVNLGWGILNLLPMLPLDGGNLMSAAFEGVAGPPGRTAARVISILVAVGVGLLFLSVGDFVAPAFCALFIFTNVQGLRAERRRPLPEAATGAALPIEGSNPVRRD
jgi:Zn-dependent protease